MGELPSRAVASMDDLASVEAQEARLRIQLEKNTKEQEKKVMELQELDIRERLADLETQKARLRTQCSQSHDEVTTAPVPSIKQEESVVESQSAVSAMGSKFEPIDLTLDDEVGESQPVPKSDPGISACENVESRPQDTILTAQPCIQGQEGEATQPSDPKINVVAPQQGDQRRVYEDTPHSPPVCEPETTEVSGQAPQAASTHTLQCDQGAEPEKVSRKPRAASTRTAKRAPSNADAGDTAAVKPAPKRPRKPRARKQKAMEVDEEPYRIVQPKTGSGNDKSAGDREPSPGEVECEKLLNSNCTHALGAVLDLLRTSILPGRDDLVNGRFENTRMKLSRSGYTVLRYFEVDVLSLMAALGVPHEKAEIVDRKLGLWRLGWPQYYAMCKEGATEEEKIEAVDEFAAELARR